MDPHYMSAEDIAKRLQCSPRTVKRWWKIEKSFPPPEFVRKGIELWDSETVNWWMKLWRYISAYKRANGDANRPDSSTQRPDSDQTHADSGQMKIRG